VNRNKSVILECYICGVEQETYYVELFVVGSEGCHLCLACRNIITDIARQLNQHRFRAQWSHKIRRGICNCLTIEPIVVNNVKKCANCGEELG